MRGDGPPLSSLCIGSLRSPSCRSGKHLAQHPLDLRIRVVEPQRNHLAELLSAFLVPTAAVASIQRHPRTPRVAPFDSTDARTLGHAPIPVVKDAVTVWVLGVSEALSSVVLR